mmetsp:Transcript_28898/g.43417  ORF Transcript_28898/g.43417 Transcript_28898/m.43417 type:complete len:213 (+) Transcript_28898:114-752(+)
MMLLENIMPLVWRMRPFGLAPFDKSHHPNHGPPSALLRMPLSSLCCNSKNDWHIRYGRSLIAADIYAIQLLPLLPEARRCFANYYFSTTFISHHDSSPSLLFHHRFYLSSASPKHPLKCLSIFCTPPPTKRPEPTSSSVLYRALIVSSWTLSVLDAFKLPLFLATHRQLSFVDLAMLCCANLQVVGLDLPRDAHTERRLTKFITFVHEKMID